MSLKSKELVQTLIPLVQRYSSPAVPVKKQFDFINRFADVLDDWGYNPREIQGIDRKSFFSLLHSWTTVANAKDVSIIKSVFQ